MCQNCDYAKDKYCICGHQRVHHILYDDELVDCDKCNCLEYKEIVELSVDDMMGGLDRLNKIISFTKDPNQTCRVCGETKDLGYNNLYELVCLVCHKWLEDFAKKFNKFNEARTNSFIEKEIYKTLGIKDTRDADILKEVGIIYE